VGVPAVRTVPENQENQALDYTNWLKLPARLLHCPIIAKPSFVQGRIFPGFLHF
jgi:hypothetical protein